VGCGVDVAISCEAMERLALGGKALNKSGCLAFFKLACAVDHKNRVVIDWEEFRQSLGVSLVVAQRAVGVLVGLNVMAERSGAGSVYQFNPSFVWGGDPGDHEQGLEDWRRREQIKIVPELVVETPKLVKSPITNRLSKKAPR
jgi:hypothetical protein